MRTPSHEAAARRFWKYTDLADAAEADLDQRIEELRRRTATDIERWRAFADIEATTYYRLSGVEDGSPIPNPPIKSRKNVEPEPVDQEV